MPPSRDYTGDKKVYFRPEIKKCQICAEERKLEQPAQPPLLEEAVETETAPLPEGMDSSLELVCCMHITAKQ